VKDIVIDANVLGYASGEDRKDYRPENLKVLSFLLNLQGNTTIKITVDHDRQILNEYSSRAKDNKFIKAWFYELQRSNRFDFQSHSLKTSIRKELKRIGFHEKDFKYVGVCLNSSTPQVIVNETDSDWNTVVCTYLKTLDIDVVNSSTCSANYL
jgi:hypothetical protein